MVLFKLFYFITVKRFSNTVEFIEKARLIHENKYNYDEVNYINSKTKIKILCTEHGYFNQTPNGHLNGTGCSKCHHKKQSENQTLDVKYFIEKANKIWNNFYDYSKVKYVKAIKPVIVICPIHSDFLVSPNNHLRNRGCPKCGRIITTKYHQENPVGWSYSNWEKAALKSKHFESFKVYMIECYNDNERFIKIGRTFNTIEKRFASKIEMPYEYKIIDIRVFDNSRECCEVELKLKNKYKKFKYKPLINFGGSNECFYYEREIIKLKQTIS